MTPLDRIAALRSALELIANRPRLRNGAPSAEVLARDALTADDLARRGGHV